MRLRQRIPNFNNFGVIFRTIILVNFYLIIYAFTSSDFFAEFIAHVLQYSSIVQPILLLSILLAYGCNAYLIRMQYLNATLLLSFMTLMSAFFMNVFFKEVLFVEYLPSLTKTLILTCLIFLSVLYYFYLTDKAYSPAIQEARIQALQARIRPHFLFNSINAALSLIRDQPKQAETALEDMADLFRVFMADNRELIPLSCEVALCKQYLALEKLRLEERLILDWQVQEEAFNAMVPSLVVQPLLENAVYHGIEPLTQGGAISIKINIQNERLHILISNPFSDKNKQHQGNKMAINNIKERLHLHFDLEATLTSKQTEQTYQVHIALPLHTVSTTAQKSVI